jgi:hypothetical protein
MYDEIEEIVAFARGDLKHVHSLPEYSVSRAGQRTRAPHEVTWGSLLLTLDGQYASRR